MSNFLDTVERIRGEEASVQRLFGDAGTRVSDRRRSPKYLAQLAEAATFIAEVTDGRRPFYHLKEAMSTSDFPILFADVLDRQLLAHYQEISPTWQNYIKRSVVPDFRPVKRTAVDGAEGALEPVGELEEYPESELHETQDEYSVSKFGRRLDLSWEALINDDLDAFRSAPERLARGARRTEERFAAGLFVDANGPHRALYSSRFGNIVPGNPELTFEGLQEAFLTLASMTDDDGEPIVIDGVELVVPPALMVQANNLLNAIQLNLTASGGTSNTEVVAVNWMRSRVRLSVNPYIPILADNANGNTSWFLFANPNTGRPAAEIGFLRGHEEPALYERVPDARRIGGGEVMESFSDDSRAWRVRHVIGGARLTKTGGAKATVASNGSGS